jgi:hypothetical protein
MTSGARGSPAGCAGHTSGLGRNSHREPGRRYPLECRLPLPPGIGSAGPRRGRPDLLVRRLLVDVRPPLENDHGDEPQEREADGVEELPVERA